MTASALSLISQSTTLVAAGEAGVRWISGKYDMNSTVGLSALNSMGSLAQNNFGKAGALLAQAAPAVAVLSKAEQAIAGRSLGAISQSAGGVLGLAGNVLQLSGGAAQARQIVSAAGTLSGTVTGILQRNAAANGAAPVLSVIAPSSSILPAFSPVSGAATGVGAGAHLLILSGSSAAGPLSFYFNLSTAAYDTLIRKTDYRVASQERLIRRPALQAVGPGGESITVKGSIFTARKSGAGQLNKLRAIGAAMQPLTLTTGYGEVLGIWYLVSIEEEQSALLKDGVPRKQEFSLEFQRYGEDSPNL
jgi:phage protein U